MRKIIAGIIAAALLTLSACGMGGVTEGTVTSKNVSQEEIMKEECTIDYDYKTVNGKKKKVRDDDCEDVATGEFEDVYTLTLENKDGDTGDVTVSEDEFNSVDEGDYFKE